MIKIKQRTAFVAALSVLAGAAIVYATIARAMPPSSPYDPVSGEDAAIWQSSSQAQVEEMIERHVADPKAIYRIINESFGKRQEGYVATNLLNRLKKDPENPQLTIVAAYAVVQAVGDGSRALWGQGSPGARALMPDRSFTLGLVTPDIWEKLDDPALMVMAAAVRSEKLNESVGDDMKPHRAEERLPIIELCRRATEIDPSWADTHFWHGRMLLQYWFALESPDPSERDSLVTAKAELLKAAELDAGLKSDAYWQLSFVLENLKESKEALSYFNQAIKLRRSGYGISPELIERTRKRLQGEAAN